VLAGGAAVLLSVIVAACEPSRLSARSQTVVEQGCVVAVAVASVVGLGAVAVAVWLLLGWDVGAEVVEGAGATWRQ